MSTYSGSGMYSGIETSMISSHDLIAGNKHMIYLATILINVQL